MGSSPESKPDGVKRVVFKEIVEGDFRKFRAEANDADSGGGARDLRFRPHDSFEPIFRKLFPNVQQEIRQRGGARGPVDVLVGRLTWSDKNGRVESKEARYEPPTDARPGEGRIPVVHTFPPFNKLPPTNEGRMLVLLVQRDDGTVWPEFATEDGLRSGQWNEAVSKLILRSLGATRRSGQVARGFIDFETDQEFSDA